MNKKITSILLTILYLTSNSGFAMNLNYIASLVLGSDDKMCEMESCSMDDMSSCKMNAFSCDMDMDMTTSKENIPTINDVINEGLSHTIDTKSCQPHFVILITNKDVVTSGYEYKALNINFESNFSNIYSYLLKRMYADVSSTSDFNRNTEIITPHKEPIFIEYGRLILYS